MAGKWTEAYSRGALQDFLTISMLMEADGTTVEEIQAIVAERSREVQPAAERFSRKHWERMAPRCPDCGAALALREILLPAGRGNENGYRSQWFCPSNACLYENYSTLPVTELLAQMAIRGGGRRPKRGCNKEA